MPRRKIESKIKGDSMIEQAAMIIDRTSEEFLLDEVTGKRRKPVMSVLNKTKLSKHEMDDLFLGAEEAHGDDL